MFWPLQTSEGDWLLYLTETPYVKYTGGREVQQENCLIDPKLVNNRQLGKARQSRQLEGQDYHLGTGAIIDSG